MAQERGSTIQSVGPQNIAQLVLGLKGGDVPQNILVPDLLGTIELGRRSELELLWEQDILPFSISVDVAAVAAQNSFISFDTPAPPVPWITVIDGVQVLAVVAAKLVAFYVAGAFGGTVANWFARDLRFGPRPQSAGSAEIRLPGVTWGTSALAGATTPALWRSAISSVGALPFPGVVMRGQGDAGVRLVLALDTVNLPLSINVSGYSVPVKAT